MLRPWLHNQITSAVALALVASGTAGAAPVPVVDTTSSSPVANVSREQLEKLPVGRRLEDLIRTCPSNTIPTVSGQSNVLIDGTPLVDLNCVQPADIEMVEVYRVHNSARAEYGAPALAWDPALVLSAGTVARERARTGTLEHSSREGRRTVRENISQGLPWWSTGQLLGNWTKEKANFVPGVFPNVSRTHNWYDIGHWAQMIWIQTVLIGCARAAGIGSSWLVCHYNPGGNKDGKVVGIPPARPYMVEAPKLPTTEVYGQTAPGRPVQPRLIGGDYGGNPAAVGTTVNSTVPDMTVRTAPQFDLGIYAGGTYTTDWFNVGDEGPKGESSALSLMINGMLDFGDDDGLSGFVGGGWVAARVEHNNLLIFSNASGAMDESDVELARQLLQLGCSPPSTYCDTNVVAPTMPSTEVYKSNQVAPAKVASATSTKQEPSNAPSCDPGGSFWDAEKMYKAAKEAGDAGGMEHAKGLMQAAIGRQWQTMEDSTEAGEMVSVSRYSLGDFLGKMMDSYKEATGQLPPGYYESPNGFTNENVRPDPAAPALPASEVFNPANAPNCPLDVM